MAMELSLNFPVTIFLPSCFYTNYCGDDLFPFTVNQKVLADTSPAKGKQKGLFLLGFF